MVSISNISYTGKPPHGNRNQWIRAEGSFEKRQQKRQSHGSPEKMNHGLILLSPWFDCICRHCVSIFIAPGLMKFESFVDRPLLSQQTTSCHFDLVRRVYFEFAPAHREALNRRDHLNVITHSN